MAGPWPTMTGVRCGNRAWGSCDPFDDCGREVDGELVAKPAPTTPRCDVRRGCGGVVRRPGKGFVVAVSGFSVRSAGGAVPRVLAGLSALTAAALVGVALPTVAAAVVPPINTTYTIVPAANPDLSVACGLDVVLMLDWSGSIYSTGNLTNVQNAAKSILAGFQDTNTRVSLIKFSSTAAAASPTLANGLVTSSSIRNGGAHTLGLQQPLVSARTNWQAAFGAAHAQFATARAGVPKLVITVTDGAPNTFGDGTTELAEGDASAVDPGVAEMNQLKAEGVHSLVVGVGGVDDTLPYDDRRVALNRISENVGGLVSPGAAFDAAATDLILSDNYTALSNDLRSISTAICAGSLSVTHLVSTAANPLNATVPVAGWSVPTTIDTLVPWIKPVASGGASQTGTTDAGGTALFQWDNGASWTTNATFTDIPLANYGPGTVTCNVPVTKVGSTYRVQVQSGGVAPACTIANLWTGPLTPSFTTQATAAVVNYGKYVTYKGTLRTGKGAVAGTRVYVQARTGAGRWVPFTSVVTSATGGWTTTFRPLINRTYRAVVPASTALSSLGSPATLIKVAGLTSVKTSASVLRKGKTVTFTGAIAPNTGIRKAYLQRLVGTRWVNVKVAKLTTRGAYKLTFTSKVKATRAFRVVHPADALHAAGVSVRKNVRWK